MQVKASVFTFLLLFTSLAVFSNVDSLSIKILQKTLQKHQSLKSIGFHYSYSIQSMDQDFNWTNTKNDIGNYMIKKPSFDVLENQQNEVLDNVQYLYFDALQAIQIALKNKSSKLSCGCSPLPYYVIDLNNIPYRGPDSKKYTEHKTVYIDTVDYLIHAITSVSNIDSGQIQLKTFTMDSVIAVYKQAKKAPPIFQLNKHMLQPGETAPAFSLADTDGKMVNLSDYQGKLLLLDFWYSACKPCIKASFDLEDLQKKYSNRGLVILGMNTMDKADKARRHNKKHKITYNSTVCNRTVKAAYKIRSYPSFYLIDETGKIVFSTSGYSSALKAELESAILQALSNR